MTADGCTCFDHEHSPDYACDCAWEPDLCGCGDTLKEGEELCPACRDVEALFPAHIDGPGDEA